MRHSRRALFNSIALILFAALAWLFWMLSNIAMVRTDLYTGIALFGLVVFLALFNARKKVPFLPVFRVATWMQFHIYAGLFSIVLFVIHLDFRWPSGVLETTLALVFLIVAISGIVGLAITRILPRLMNQSGQPAIYEKIPRLRKTIRDEVRELAMKAEETCNSSSLPEFYLEHLCDYLNARPSIFRSLNFSKRRLSYRIRNELAARMRYLSDDEAKIAAEMEEWIQTKENLDFQDASQRVLKLWLFIHIPFTFSLLLLGAVHGIFAFLYGGSR